MVDQLNKARALKLFKDLPDLLDSEVVQEIFERLNG
jgi:hypothetical protein